MSKKLIPPIVFQIVFLFSGCVCLAWVLALVITPIAENVRDSFNNYQNSASVSTPQQKKTQKNSAHIRKTPNQGIPLAYPSTPAIVKINEAKMAYDRSDYEEACRLWREALDLNPVHPGWIWHDIGLCNTDMRRWDEAADAYTHAMEMAVSVKDKANSYELRADIYARQSRWEEALSDLEEAQRLAPQYFRSGRLLQRVKNELNEL